MHKVGVDLTRALSALYPMTGTFVTQTLIRIFTRSDYVHIGNAFACSIGDNFELCFILDSKAVRLYTSSEGSYAFSVRCCTEKNVTHVLELN